ncbi:MAG: DUF3848 domain-containing protein [Ruminiclostridium sp.]|nr:DUF3848 domain-containing protein [Ruminiclostridium sp.]
MANRDENIEILTERLDERQLRKVISQGYSDISLSLMAKCIAPSAKRIANSVYSASTVNKLTEALKAEKIDDADFWHIMEYAEFSNTNEKYIDDFLDSIDKGIYHRCAADLFTALQYEDMSYNEGLAYVRSGAFYPTEYASVTVTENVAKELFDMGVRLRACEGFNYYYDVDDIKRSLNDHDAIFVGDRDLAVKVNEYMKSPDWHHFKEYVTHVMGRDMDSLTGNKLDELRVRFAAEKNMELLFNKVKQEYDSFIADLRTKPADEIIAAAYEITTKNEIVSYCEYQTPVLSDKQYNALLSSSNTLDEVYEEWRDNGEYHGLYDIGLALEETADKIQISIDRQVHEQIKSQEQKPEPTPAHKNKSL